MATITLFANRINNLPEIIRDAKSSVNTFKGDLGSLITSALQVDGDICSLDDTISSLRSSTDTQEEKIDALENIADDIEDFIDEVVSIDEDAADAINQSKDDFYDEYYYLKPDCEKSGWEKFKDGLKAVGEWCKEHWKFIVTVVIVIAAIVCLFVPGVNAAIAGMVFGKIILGAAAGALMGAISGGLMGGIMSALTGGSFFEGFEEGAFSGALTGALMGGLGGAGEILGESIKCVSTLGKAVKATAKISSILSSGMGLFDSAAMVIGMFDPDNAFVRFNQRLHESKLYNGIQFGIDGLAALTGGMTKTMKCFVAGTMIATVSGLVAIENIRVGDRVMATDPETGETAAKTVLETYIREAETLIHIRVGGEELITTETHPFYVKGRGFVDAEELRAGDELLDINGRVIVIESIEIEKTEPTKVYNFKVEDFHTYHVGENGILVHNADYPAHMNPDGSLKPNTEYTTGEYDYTYKTNADGYIESVHADELHMKNHEGRLHHNSNTPGKISGDHAGHLIADQFGGSPQLDNLVSQNGFLNTHEYRAMEREWANALKNGTPVTNVDIKVNYASGSSRPTSFNVSYQIDGIRNTLQFINGGSK
ncbi:polymorphic toxin-type HINT domain-containing protein [Ruminococcus sp.]|uniref:polymorphic toxin-type HINT domain-containing protein n=1 Tax=Ruminococcus sp. TaxID=41978 RepID=UPI0025CFAC68|nr:polymorphic toxin-type HINT domain-containing protein [Ruminococcus sp.]MBQ6251429.1 DNA/RNA non-specific endonuclease [Ruminococcus sp.]